MRHMRFIWGKVVSFVRFECFSIFFFCSLILFHDQIVFQFSLQIAESKGSNNDGDDAKPFLLSYFLLILLRAPVYSLPSCKHLFSKRTKMHFSFRLSTMVYWNSREGGKAHNASLVNCAEYSSLGVNKWRTFAEWPFPLVMHIMA